MSFNLKEETKKKFGKVKVAFAPKSSLCCDDVVDRDNIIVDLSLVTGENKVFNMEQTSNIQQIFVIRQKQKEIASKEVNYSHIVTSSDDYIVISGVPGCGKTTLVETILHKWGSNELWNNDQVKFDFVFVLYFRKLTRFKQRLDITAEDILSHFYPEYDLMQHKKTHSLLILDGFDELSTKEELRSSAEEFTSFTRTIYDLLDPNNSKLQFTRLVTSRPGSCPIIFETVLKQHCCQRVFEVTGFSDENTTRYIYKHFPDNNQAQEVVRKLKDTPIVYDMMFIPFYCWGVCYLIKNDVPIEEFGQTYTALYINLLTLFIRNHGLRTSDMKIKDVLKHPKFKDTCLGLAKLAFDLEGDGKVNFTQQDLPEEINMEELMRDSGMIIEIESDITSSTTYQFLHYTFHEFLVALHMFVEEDKSLRRSKIQIQAMLAGLLGGSLNPSESSTMVQRFCKQFSVRNEMRISDIILSKHSDFIELEDLYSIIHEYHNPVNVDREIIVKKMRKSDSPYCKQCVKFVNNLHARKQLQFEPLKLHYYSMMLLNQEDGFLLRLLQQCKELITDLGFKSHLTRLINVNNLQFERLIIYNLTGSNYDLYFVLVQHTQVLEIVDTVNSLTISQILRLFANLPLSSRMMKKLVFHTENVIDVNEILDLADVCEEVVVAYNSNLYLPCLSHTHNTECVGPRDWEHIIAAQKYLTELLPKTLKKISIGASCLQDPFHSSTVIFSPEELQSKTLTL